MGITRDGTLYYGLRTGGADVYTAAWSGKFASKPDIMEDWDKLSAEEHALLCSLPAPHGPLFAWLESQLHDHGPQPWAALREGLRGHAFEGHATAQLAQIPEGIESDWSEVRSILAQLLKLSQQRELNELAQRAATDPLAMQRYKALSAQLRG